MSALLLPESRRNPIIPVILVGAYDRHNFGDMLFPHIVSRLLQGKNTVYGGLKQRDMRPYGGHDVQALNFLSHRYSGKPVHILYAGGELLTCSLWEAAVMLLPASNVHETVVAMSAPPFEKLKWAQHYLGLRDQVPYTVSTRLFPQSVSITYNAVGGADLSEQCPDMQMEVFNKLNQASRITVRDRSTQKTLEAAGIASGLIPDSAVMTAELFTKEIKCHAVAGEPAEAISFFPQGYIAVQFSNDFGDDRSLSQLAIQLDELAASTGLGISLFRAGAAPWHDDLSNLRRLAARMRTLSPYIFNSLNLWDICALIAESQAYCGSSLHGLIVAGSFAKPRICIRHVSHPEKAGKHEAYIDTWESFDMAQIADIKKIAERMHYVMKSEPEKRCRQSREMMAIYRQDFASLQSFLTDRARLA